MYLNDKLQQESQRLKNERKEQMKNNMRLQDM